MSPIERFRSRLHQEWLEPFCVARGMGLDGFVCSSLDKLAPEDARDFMHALDGGLVNHHQGTFQTPLSKAKEQIFWEGPRDSVPRKLTLWLEPIITIAGLARLHREQGWPAHRLGLQSRTWAFDLVGYQVNLHDELLVCEVKKSNAEVHKLLDFMAAHARTAPDMAATLKGPELNAFRKVLALRQSACSVFWALGPGGGGQVFRVIRSAGDVRLLPASGFVLACGD